MHTPTSGHPATKGPASRGFSIMLAAVLATVVGVALAPAAQASGHRATHHVRRQRAHSRRGPRRAHPRRLTRSEVGELFGMPGISLTHGGRSVAPKLGPSRLGGRGSARVATRPAGRPVPQRFTATSRTYVGARGIATTRVFSEPVNYRRGGRWAPIDDRLVQSPRGFRNRANSYSLLVPRALPGAVRISKGKAWVQFALGGARGMASVRGNSVTYAGALPGAALTYAAKGAGVKESLVLSGEQVASTYQFVLSTSRGLRLTRRHGALVALNRARKVVFSFGRPFAAIQSGAVLGQTRGVNTRLLRQRGGWRLTLSVPTRWLRRSLRHHRVVIDPTVSANFVQDCMIESDSPNTNFCSSNTDEVGWDVNHDHHSLLQFDIAGSIPQDSLILNAQLAMYLFNETTSTAKSVSAVRVTRGWTQGVTWNTYDGTNDWTTPGGDTAGDYTSTNPSVGGSLGWYYWYPTQLVQAWEDDMQVNDGLLLEDTNAQQTSNGLHFYSSLGPSGFTPYMDITWEPRGIGDQRQFTMLRTPLTDKMTADVNVASGDLHVNNDDMDLQGTGLPIQMNRMWDSLLDEKMTYFRWNGWYPWGSIMPDGTFVDSQPDGSFVPFLIQPDGTYKTPIGLDASLCKIGQSGCSGNPTKDSESYTGATPTYVLTYNRSGTKVDFDHNGALLSITDRHNNAIVAQLNAGFVKDFLDTQGREIDQTSATSDDYVGSITDWTGRHVNYSYNTADNNKLTSYTDANGKTTNYSWDSGFGGDLLQITDPNGQITKFTYDSDHRITSLQRITDNVAMTGPETQFAYYDGGDTTHGHSCVNANSDKKTVVTDDNGNQTTYCSNAIDEVLETYDALGNKRTQDYSPSGKVVDYTDPTFADNPGGLHSVDFTFSMDGLDNPLTASETAGTNASSFQLTSSLSYVGAPGGSGPGGNGAFDPWRLADPQGQHFGFEYNTTRDITRSGPLASGDGSFATGNTQAAYNTSGTLSSTTDGDGFATTYGYSPTGTSELASATPPDTTKLGAKSFTEDSLGRIKTMSDGNGNTWTYNYDPLDRITNINYAHGGSSNNVGFVYDADGNVTQRTDDVNGNTSYHYDKLNRLTEEDFPNAVVNDYGYDGASNLTSFTDAAGTYTYGYRADNELASIVQPSAQGTITYDAFDFTNNKQAMHYPNGVDVTTTYDLAGRRTEILAKHGTNTLEDLKYSYDSGSSHRQQLQTATDALTGNITTYTYGDPLERLTQAQTKTSGGTILSTDSYTYDGAGNVTSHNSSTYSYNHDNQRTSSGDGSDLNGNVTGEGGGPTVGYNARNQTTSVSGTVFGWLGAGQNELMADGSTGLHYGRLGLEWRFDGTSTDYYTRTPNGQLAGILKNTGGTITSRYPLFDQLGSVIAQTDANGAAARTFSYSPYGFRTASGGTVFDDTIGYAGAAQTTGNLLHFGERLYDPTSGRWTQMDPLGSDPASLQDDPIGALTQNYRYASDDPVNNVDPTGLMPQGPPWRDELYCSGERARRQVRFCVWVYDQIDEYDPHLYDHGESGYEYSPDRLGY